MPVFDSSFLMSLQMASDIVILLQQTKERSMKVENYSKPCDGVQALAYTHKFLTINLLKHNLTFM